jgi:hypothetical protein
MAGTQFVNNLSIYFSAYSTFGRGAVWFSNNHYQDYEDADKRVLDGVSHNYFTNTGVPYFYPSWQSATYRVVNSVTYNNNGTTDNRAYTIKFADVNDPTVANSDAHYPLMRYAELPLIYAERSRQRTNSGSLFPAERDPYKGRSLSRARRHEPRAIPQLCDRGKSPGICPGRGKEI